jgi:hypothetical protein
VRQHDSQLIVQLMKKLAELWIVDGGFHHWLRILRRSG